MNYTEGIIANSASFAKQIRNSDPVIYFVRCHATPASKFDDCEAKVAGAYGLDDVSFPTCIDRPNDGRLWKEFVEVGNKIGRST